MYSKISLTNLFVAICVCVGVAVIFLGTQSRAANSLDSPEAEEVKAAIQRADEAMTIAQTTGNLDKLEEALIDHPDYLLELKSEQAEELRSFITRILGPEASKNFGYLTAMKNKMTYRQQGQAFVQSAIEEANAAGREFTNADLQALSAQNPDKHIVWPKSSTDFVLPDPTQFQYKAIWIKDDKARAVYDDGIRDKVAILVRIDGRWYVAGIF